MPVEFIGMIFHRRGSDLQAFAGAGEVAIDRGYLRRFAQVHEDANFDRVLIGTASLAPEGSQIAAYAAAHTERLSFLVSHRPGFRAPTVAARELATLDQLSQGRAAVHIITGGHDAEQRRDGDFLGKDERYARTDEYLDVVRKAWTATEPFDYKGRFYQVEGYASGVRPLQKPSLPLYFGGSSDAAYRVGSKHADVYALWGEPLAETRQQIESIRAAASAAGRSTPPRISVSFRPILGATEEIAWERAGRILEAVKGNLGALPARWFSAGPKPVGSQRLLAAAEKGDRHDRALWTAIAKATGAPGNSTALVGTAETVAQALLDYYELGVTTFLIRGFDPFDDAIDFGRELIPRVREEVRRREARISGLSLGGTAAASAAS
ncbi:MAG TPA: LLM class flavin-dependent oxidoreductase [Polyangiaceae bacterium]|jgi:alkanesulfonate monooxygenase|nr:LLM class flavin-dependent oxidoreductase [Polyangiaceae bacterium]